MALLLLLQQAAESEPATPTWVFLAVPVAFSVLIAIFVVATQRAYDRVHEEYRDRLRRRREKVAKGDFSSLGPDE